MACTTYMLQVLVRGIQYVVKSVKYKFRIEKYLDLDRN